MATIKEVAEKAHVSVATVSRVLNKNSFVSPDLELRVLQAMRELNYHPNAVAKSLRSQRNHIIGVLIPQLDQPFFSALTFAIEKNLFEHDYRSLICSVEEEFSKETSYIDMFLRQRVDGVIIVPSKRSAESIQRLLEQDIPVVIVDRDVPRLEGVHRVLVNNYQGGYLAMKHLVELRHRRIGMICAPQHSEPILHRISGAQMALTEANLEFDPELVITDDLLHFEMGYSAAKTLLHQYDPPTAIFALTDVIAVGVLHALGEMNIKVPQEVSVVGFDNIPLAAYVLPALTTVAQPIYDLGTHASQTMLAAIDGKLPESQRYTLEPELIVRNSTAVAAVSQRS